MISWPVDTRADIFFNDSIYVGNDVKFVSLARGVFERDSFTCSYCRFQCSPSDAHPNAFFQVYAIDRNYRNLTPGNLKTICPFCHSFFNLRASLRSGNYIPIRHDHLKPTQLSMVAKAIFAELSSKKNSLYDAANAFYKELEGFSSNIPLPEFTTIQFESEDSGERARKARIAFILNIIALSDGGGYATQTQVALKQILPLPRWTSFLDMSDYYDRNSFSPIRKSGGLMNLFSRM